MGPGQAPPPAPLPNPLLLGLDPSSYVLRSLGAIKAAELEQALLLLSFSDALRLLRYLADWCKQRAQVGGRAAGGLPVAWQGRLLLPDSVPQLRVCTVPASHAVHISPHWQHPMTSCMVLGRGLPCVVYSTSLRMVMFWVPGLPTDVLAARHSSSCCVVLLHATQAELCCRVAVLLLRLHHGALTSTPSARPTLLALHAQLRPALQALKDTLGFNCAALKYLQRSAKEGSIGADSVLAAPGGGAALAAARQMLRGEA